MKKINKKRGRETLSVSKGYTIIETMISVSLFLVIVMAGLGALLNANLVHQKSHNMRSIMDNLSFVMEEMSRNLRTGSQYYCINGSDDLSNVNRTKSGENCWGIAFEPPNGTSSPSDQWVYYRSLDGKIFKSVQGPYSLDNFFQITPDEVVVNVNSFFSVLGAEGVPGNQQQPLVIIRLFGTVTYKNVVTPFSLQTSASQRLIDV